MSPKIELVEVICFFTRHAKRFLTYPISGFPPSQPRYTILYCGGNPSRHLLVFSKQEMVGGANAGEIEVRPRWLVPDTNCFIDHLPLLQAIADAPGQPYTLAVPLVGEFAP